MSEKLKLLVRFRPTDLLYVVDEFFNSNKSEVREWLIEYIAEYEKGRHHLRR